MSNQSQQSNSANEDRQKKPNIVSRFISWWFATFSRQKLVGKIIFGGGSLCIVCFAFSICVQAINPRPPVNIEATVQAKVEATQAAQSQAVEVTQIADAPTSTPEPTNAPISTNTPAPTSTPAPTNTPAPELAFVDIIQNPDEKGWTSTQYSTYFDTIKGQYVSGWSGTVLEIDEYTGKPYLSLDMKPGEPKIDAYIYINESDVLKVGLGQNVTFAGTIESNWSENNGFYALQIEDVTLQELSEIPPTPTPGPTSTPTPDIGTESMAQVMCRDFVRDNLKAPSTADFGGLLDDWEKAVFMEAEKASEFGIDTAKLRNSGIWVVVGQVDAQNAFGAMIRSQYTCVMDYDKNTQNWYLLDISIE